MLHMVKLSIEFYSKVMWCLRSVVKKNRLKHGQTNHGCCTMTVFACIRKFGTPYSRVYITPHWHSHWCDRWQFYASIASQSPIYLIWQLDFFLYLRMKTPLKRCCLQTKEEIKENSLLFLKAIYQNSCSRTHIPGAIHCGLEHAYQSAFKQWTKQQNINSG